MEIGLYMCSQIFVMGWGIPIWVNEKLRLSVEAQRSLIFWVGCGVGFGSLKLEIPSQM